MDGFCLPCFLCGDKVGHRRGRMPKHEWMSKGRAFYWQNKTSQPAITGTNTRLNIDMGFLLFPLDSDRTMSASSLGDFEGLAFASGISAPVNSHSDIVNFSSRLTANSASNSTASNKDSYVRPIYLVHESCWQLLKIYAEPKELPLRILYSFLVSFPRRHQGNSPAGAIDFGHYYNDEFVRHQPVPDIYIPWRWLRQRYLEGSPWRMDEPFDIPDLQIAFANSTGSSTSQEVDRSIHKIAQEDWNLGLFKSVPNEIILKMLRHVPTKSIPALQEACPRLATIISSQNFYRTRFEPGGESHFVFEARTKGILNKGSIDWKSLHRFSQSGSVSFGNRLRLYNILTKILDVVMQIQTNSNVLPPLNIEEVTDSSKPSGPSYNPKCIEKDPTLVWRVVESYEQSKSVEASKPLPKDIVQVGISTISWNEQNYVCGVRFITPSGDDSVESGYITKNSETILNLQELGKFVGFKVALGEEGIYALKVVTTGAESPWINKKPRDGSLITYRLSALEDPQYITSVVDGFKMCRLGMGYRKSPLSSPSFDLRQNALWYPDVPPAGSEFFFVSEDSTREKFVDNSKFAPLRTKVPGPSTSPSGIIDGESNQYVMYGGQDDDGGYVHLGWVREPKPSTHLLNWPNFAPHSHGRSLRPNNG